MIYTITLNPSIDQHITVAKLVKDDTLRALSVRQYPGGKGINVSRGLHILGHATKAFTFIGGTAGHLFQDLLKREKIDYESVRVSGETRINHILTDLSDKTQTRISMPGPQVDKASLRKMTQKINGAEPRPVYWALGGSLPESVPVDIYRTIIESLQSRGEKCVLDTDGTELKEGLKAKPYLIKPNEFEMQRLIGRPLADEKDIQKAALEICGLGVEVVAVTLGERGGLVASPSESYFLEAPKIEAKSKVGAGDSFIAGFLSALTQGGDLLAAARSGIAAGTAAVAKEGTQLYSREDYERLLPLIRYHRLA